MIIKKLTKDGKKVACILSLEAGEAFFSLATRYCRVTQRSFGTLVSNPAYIDYKACRDFPIMAHKYGLLEKTSFDPIEKLFTTHSSSFYFGSTIPLPFRRNEIAFSCKNVGMLLRFSIGENWSHLRYCRVCAKEEFRQRRFSWWHRDHQLPLTYMCVKHRCVLINVPLTALSDYLPHELIKDDLIKNDVGSTRVGDGALDFLYSLAKFEADMARMDMYSWLKSTTDEISKSLDNIISETILQTEFVLQRINLHLIPRIPNDAPSLKEDRALMYAAMQNLLNNGYDYSDPIAVIFLIFALRLHRRAQQYF